MEWLYQSWVITRWEALAGWAVVAIFGVVILLMEIFIFRLKRKIQTLQDKLPLQQGIESSNQGSKTSDS